MPALPGAPVLTFGATPMRFGLDEADTGFAISAAFTLDEARNWQQVEVTVPLAELFGYATRLRSRTQGRGTFTTRPAGYQQAPDGTV